MIKRELIEKLKGNHFVTFDQIPDQEETAKDISKRDKNRSYEQILNHCISGKILEVALSNAINGKIIGGDPPYLVDVDSEYGKFEVKTDEESDIWFGFNKGKEIKNKGANLYNYLNNGGTKNTDYLITGYWTLTNKGFKVIFKQIMSSKTFENYIQESKYQDKGTHYYNFVRGVKDNNCFVF